MGAKLSADVERALAVGDLVIPGAQVQDWLIEVNGGGPHKPPAVVRLLQNSAIWAGAAIERVGDRIFEIAELHGIDCSWVNPILAGTGET